MILIYLITCLILILIVRRLTNKNYREIREIENYLDSYNKVSIKIERIEKSNIKAIHKLLDMNQKNKLAECRRK